MARFYQIARLTSGQTIFPHEAGLRIDLDAVKPDDLIENDVAFRTAVAPDTWFWLSGGGTLLLNNRYLAVVRRSPEARVNPGKFSLFTGRADNDAERADPSLIVRELFEELLLYEDGTLLMPRFPAIQPLVDEAYDVMRKVGVIPDGPVRDMPLTPVALPARPVAIRHGGVWRDHRLAWTVNANNDINLLSLFAAECDIGRLVVRDGEFHVANGVTHRAGRDIYLLDLEEQAAKPLYPGRLAGIPPTDAMTPALRFLLDACRGNRGM